jgi:hypothetical protein
MGGKKVILIRGTTPTIEIELPFSADLLAEAFVTIAQHRIVVIDKSLKDCEVNGNVLTLRLTQKETLLMDGDCISEIQIRGRTVTGDAVASEIVQAATARILKEGVI